MSVSLEQFNEYIAQKDAIGIGKVLYVDAANGTSQRTGRSASQANASLLTALGKVITGRNDLIKLLASTSQDNLAAALTWDENLTHLKGEGSFGRYNMRSRIGHSANFSPMITMSGYGNSVQNIYFSHGRGSATNVNLLDITGARNSYINCHFGGPFHATEAGTATYKLVKLSNSETFFKGCIFGGGTVAATAAITMVEFGAQADPPRARFEDCTFINLVSAAGGASSTFLRVLAGCGAGLAEFNNCKFINIGETAMTVGIDGTGLSNFKMAFDSNCYFHGCTDVVADAYAAYVVFPQANLAVNAVTGGASVALFNGLSVPADAS